MKHRRAVGRRARCVVAGMAAVVCAFCAAAPEGRCWESAASPASLYIVMEQYSAEVFVVEWNVMHSAGWPATLAIDSDQQPPAEVPEGVYLSFSPDEEVHELWLDETTVSRVTHDGNGNERWWWTGHLYMSNATAPPSPGGTLPLGPGAPEDKSWYDLSFFIKWPGVTMDWHIHVNPPAYLPAGIDIKPGSYPDSINLDSNGVIPVAIFSSDTFDATEVDPDTVLLAGAGLAVRGKSNKYLAHEEDVDGDGLIDLVAQVLTENLDPGQFQDGFAFLAGETYGGQAILGLDEIRIVPPES